MIEQQNPVRGFLQSINLDPAIKVKFQYNPAQLTDKRSVSYAALNAPALLMPVRQYSQGGDRTLSFTVRVDGVFKGPADDNCDISKDDTGSILPELNKYRAFLYPKTSRWNQPAARASFVPLFENNQVFASPPLCLFGFGTERIIKCLVTEIGITELMFNKFLAPMRADVAVTLVEFVPYHNGE